MLLAIDIGNTNIVFAICNIQERIEHVWRVQTNVQRSRDEYAAILKELCSIEGIAWGDITNVIMSSVVPEVSPAIVDFCQKYLKLTPHIVSSDNAGIDINVSHPEEVGADRLVNAVCVVQHYDLPAIVIDFGTATTFDVINKAGEYEGGVISPGINLSLQALHEATAKLPHVRPTKPDQVIGKTTTQAIHSGIYWGYIGLIEGLIKKLEEELGEKCCVIATGGLAPLFYKNTDLISIQDEELTLKGLMLLHQNTIRKQNKNKSQAA